MISHSKDIIRLVNAEEQTSTCFPSCGWRSSYSNSKGQANFAKKCKRRIIQQKNDSMWKQTLFNKNTAYAALVVSWPSKNKGNSAGFTFAESDVFQDKSEDVGSTEGAWSLIYEWEPPKQRR